MVELAQAHNPALVAETTALFDKFKELFRLYSQCHKIYDRNYVTDEEISELSMHYAFSIPYLRLLPIGDHIVDFMSYYRQHFPNATVLPKMHMLEEHVVPWLKKFHVGFGLLGEQGIESIHAHFNSLERTYKSIHEEVARLRNLMKEHLLHIAPENIAATPEVKRRKSKNSHPPED